MHYSLRNASMLATEAQHVIWLRLMKSAFGTVPVHTETALMISEKMAAASGASGKLLAGGSLDSVIGDYRKVVRANARRLLA